MIHDPSDEDIFSFDLLYFLTYKPLLHPDKIITKPRKIMAVIWEKVYSLPAPRQIYTFLDLSKNQLSGDVPDNIGGLKSLKLLSISYNKLSGRIPISFDDLESLESLDLSHSTLSGEIPRTFEKLLQLTVLELSDNKLKGRIPNDPRIHSTIKVLMLTIAGSVECKFRYHVRRNRQG